MAEKFVTEIVESYEDHSQNLEVNVDVNEEYQEYEGTEPTAFVDCSEYEIEGDIS